MKNRRSDTNKIASDLNEVKSEISVEIIIEQEKCDILSRLTSEAKKNHRYSVEISNAWNKS